MNSLSRKLSESFWETDFSLVNPYKNIPNSFYCHPIQDLTILLKDVYPQSFDCVIRIILAYNFHALFIRHSTYTNDKPNTIFTYPLKKSVISLAIQQLNLFIQFSRYTMIFQTIPLHSLKPMKNDYPIHLLLSHSLTDKTTDVPGLSCFFIDSFLIIFFFKWILRIDVWFKASNYFKQLSFSNA